MKTLLAIILLALTSLSIARSPAAVREFRRHNACPSTGAFSGPCPNHVVDHIMPLCLGGPDHPRNMQWQTRTDSYRKDVLEREVCRLAKKCNNSASQESYHVHF